MRGTYVRHTWRHNPTIYAPARYRKGCSYDAFIPDPISEIDIALPATLAAAISEAENAIAALNLAPPGFLAPLARLLLRTESIASSKVEGLQMDARSLARAEAKRDEGRHVGANAVEILASIDAMELAVERASTRDAVTLADLLDIHRLLMASAPHAHPGELRTQQNWIGGNDYNPCGAAFVPPPPEHVAALVDDLCAFSSDDALPPLVQAAIAHAQFETIHPFDDGNGRTGRALVHVILRRRGLARAYVPPVSVILAQKKDRYIEGLTMFREDDVTDWLEMFASAATQAARLAERYLRRILELQEQWRAQLRPLGLRSDAAAWAVIDQLPAHPVVSVRIAVAATGRTRPAVANAVDQLARCGVLLPLGESARNRSWEAAGLLDLIAGLEAGE